MPVLPDKPDVLMESGRLNHKDVLLGCNKDEGGTLTGLMPPDPYAYLKFSAYAAAIGHQVGAAQPSAIPAGKT